MDIEPKLKLYNTLTRQKEGFKPLDGLVGMYACGQTVYDKATIGNFRTYIFEDILQRVLKYNGYRVKYVQNITDVGHLVGDRDMGEDKLAVSAAKKGVNAWDLARTLEKEFFDDCKKLNILPPDISCRATENIEEQIKMVARLIEKGFGYQTKDGIYFDTGKLADYGKLAHLDLAGLQEGAKVEINQEKRNPTDFALWKFSPKDEKRQMEWDSPWGVGFPGWHIECSAMSIKYLGQPFDIHAGGIDHIPVHHTNEIAQNEALYEHPTVKYWLHGGFLQIDGRRMGKSLGNAYTLQDIVDHGFDPLAYRYLTFTAHYRQELNFTWEALQAANVSYIKLLHAATAEYPFYADLKGDFNNEWNQRFLEAIDDDLNMPKALSVVWEFLKSTRDNKETLETLIKFDEVLGFGLKERVEKVHKFMQRSEIKKIIQERKEARENKDWAKADDLRNELNKKLEGLNYEIKDN